MNVQTALKSGTSILSDAGVGSAATDARWLLAHVLDTSPSQLLISPDRVLGSTEVAKFEDAVAQRSRFKPVAQIIGRREFWGRSFEVTPDTLDPRPETETLIALALEHTDPKTILDLGTGTGCILLTLIAEFPEAAGVGTDISTAALDVATRNATSLGLNHRVDLGESNWWSDVQGRFDLIVSNPPYITEDEMEYLSKDVKNWEPHVALTPGGDGLDPYRVIAAGLGRFLSPNGTAMFEFGASQADDIVAIFEAENWLNTRVKQDLNKHDRILVVSN